MKLIKWIFIILACLIAAALIVAAFLPAEVSIRAEKDINLPPAKVFHAVATFSGRPLWDPWISIDSTAKTSVNFQDLYTGTRFSWTGHLTGTGDITVLMPVTK